MTVRFAWLALGPKQCPALKTFAILKPRKNNQKGVIVHVTPLQRLFHVCIALPSFLKMIRSCGQRCSCIIADVNFPMYSSDDSPKEHYAAQRNCFSLWKAVFIQNSHFQTSPIYLVCTGCKAGITKQLFKECWMIFTRCALKPDAEVRVVMVVIPLHIFALFILNVIPEAELCKQIRETKCHFTESMLLIGRKVRE